MSRVKLTENFYLDEFLVSETADRLGIKNTPTATHLKRIKEVTAPRMQIVREILGRAIVITSGYRNERVNKLVGGVPTSDHMDGYVADFRAAGLSALAVAQILADAMKPGKELHGLVDQLILETSRRIVHISFDPKLRGRVMTQKGPAFSTIVNGIVP